MKTFTFENKKTKITVCVWNKTTFDKVVKINYGYSYILHNLLENDETDRLKKSSIEDAKNMLLETPNTLKIPISHYGSVNLITDEVIKNSLIKEINKQG